VSGPPRELLEQQIRETESRFRIMADAAPVLLWMSRTDGLCTFFNQTWLNFTGRSQEEEWGIGWAEGIHFEDFQRCIDTYVDAFNRREVFEMEYRLRRHDGEFRWLLDRGTPRYTPDGTFAGYIGSCADITERKQLEVDLRKAVKVRDEFLSIASHELRTPLTSLKLRTEPTKEAAAWFDDQLKSLREQFQQAQEKLAQFEHENGIISTDERLDVEVARLNELSAQSLRAADLSYDAGARSGQARGGVDSAPDVLANPLVQSLKGDLLRAESKLQELATRLGPNHPQYQQQATEVQALRQRVNSETQRVIGGVQSSAGQSYARRSALEKDLAEQRKKVEALRQARSQSQVLIRDVDTAQKAYEAALQRYLVNKVEAGAKSTNVAILNPATEPMMPSKPKVPLTLGLGLFVGVLLGLAAVFFLELLDRRVRSTDDLEAGVEAPLLGTLQPWHPSRLIAGDDGTKALPSPT